MQLLSPSAKRISTSFLELDLKPTPACSLWTDIDVYQGIGAAQDAARMERVVSFYEKLPRGPAPEPKASGLLGRYQARYFGKEPSAARKSLRDLRTDK